MRPIRYSIYLLMLLQSLAVLSQESTIFDLKDKQLPEFKGLLLTGDSISSTDLKGKILLIQFLYLGCVPCMHEVRYFNALFEKLDKRMFDILAICPETYSTLKSFNDNDSSSPAHPLHRGYNIDKIDYKIIAECKEQNYPFGRPQCSTISDKFFLKGYPFSILVDKDGIIRKIYGGFPIDDESAVEKINPLVLDIKQLME